MNFDKLEHLKPNVLLKGPLFPEIVRLITHQVMGNSVKIQAVGLETGKLHDSILNEPQIQQLEILKDHNNFDGDSHLFRLGIDAIRWGLAYEYDPYFSLAIARVDPLPHQLEAVYDYFLKSARIRFLLADDPGAGKTIMAGLLLKELKIRGLAKRILIIAPANLTFQWQREMKDKFREDFEVLRGDTLRANYGQNPWQDKNQIVTSISWVSRIADAKESLLRSNWDLIIVDEAHKMSAYNQKNKTLAYQLGEKLSELTDHYLLMTATPHKGDPENFCLFLELLDKDVYGDITSLQKAMEDNVAPFYLRRTKEALVTFPDPETGKVQKLFTKRDVKTINFLIDEDEYDFYEELTRYVEDQSIKASQDDSLRGWALGFTMAMLQRRFASSVFAVRRSLERMKDKREKILENPQAYRQEQINKKLPEDFDELTEQEQQEILNDLENVVASVDPQDLRDEIIELKKLIKMALALEEREIESKLVKLKEVINNYNLFEDKEMRLLIFTEHKDTLDYLVGKLRECNLSVTQIHGGMRIGDRDTPNTRIYAEREFRESCQILVATEAAGEGINLQFCWLMINYDIPWNPIRLEQRMGRIHRYGQEKDCLILNFVATNTREGRVLTKLFERVNAIELDLDPEQTGKVFNVLGDLFPSNYLERMVREMYARNLTEDVITDRIVEQVDFQHFQEIANSTLEGLAKRELDLSKIWDKAIEAKERRLTPESIEDFFLEAAPLAGLSPKAVKSHAHQYRIGRLPRNLVQLGDRLESQYGKLGREYKNITFDKDCLKDNPTLEWVTPGHPLFEAVRKTVLDHAQETLRKGAIFFDLKRTESACLDVFTAEIRDGRGNTLHKKLFVVETSADGTMAIQQPEIFLDLAIAPEETEPGDSNGLPQRGAVEMVLYEQALQSFLAEVQAERQKNIEKIRTHLKISLNTIIDRVQHQLFELLTQKESGSTEAGLEGRIKQFEDRLYDLNYRLETRTIELNQEINCMIADIQHYGRAWVLPHPDRESPTLATMVSDAEIERIAMQAAIAYEEAKGYQVESVESQNRGFDLISRKQQPEDPYTATDVRFIEVKGRASVGMVSLSRNEYKTAQRLKRDYWLYVVFNCATQPEVHIVRDPVTLGWQPVTSIEHYQLSPEVILSIQED